jgi:membrane-associated phospholipid phosphatase
MLNTFVEFVLNGSKVTEVSNILEKIIGVLVACLLLASFPVQAQFPYETTNSTEIGVFATSAILYGAGYWVESSAGHTPWGLSYTVDELESFDVTTINAFDRPATTNWSPGAAHLSDIFMYSSMVAPLSLTLSDMGSKQPLTLTTMHAETLLLNGGLTYLLKNMFGRPRPLVYNTDPRISDSLRQSATARRSFPSGHTSTSFSSMVFLASVFSSLYPDSDARPYVWGGCLAVAGTTGYLRYKAGWHYPSDILAGAALGGFVGWLVPRLHEVNNHDITTAKPNTLPMTIGFSIAF